MKTDKGMGSMKGGKQTVLGGLTNKSPKFPTGYALKPKEANVTRSGVAPTPRTLPGRNA